MVNVENIPCIDMDNTHVDVYEDNHIYSFEELIEVSSKEDNIPIFMDWDEEIPTFSDEEEPDLSELLSILEKEEEEEPDLSELLSLLEE